jgi:hypothetical protein
VPALPGHLQTLGKRDLERERARLAARKKRAAEKERRERQGSAESPAPNSPAAAVTTPSSTISKPATTEPKLTKKERERQAKAGQTDEVYHRQANATASMALGKSKYSWMNAGSGASAAPAIGAGAGFSARLSGTQPAKRLDSTSGPSAGDVGLVSKESYKKIGLLKEGSRVELRDIVNVIERDGREPKAILNGLRRLEVLK